MLRTTLTVALTIWQGDQECFIKMTILASTTVNKSTPQMDVKMHYNICDEGSIFEVKFLTKIISIIMVLGM